MTFPNIYRRPQKSAEYFIIKIEDTFNIDYGPRPEVKIATVKEFMFNIEEINRREGHLTDEKGIRQIAESRIKKGHGSYWPLTNQILLHSISTVREFPGFKTKTINRDGTAAKTTLVHELFHKYAHNILGEEYIDRTFSTTGNYYAKAVDEGVAEFHSEEFFIKNKEEFKQGYIDSVQRTEMDRDPFFVAKTAMKARRIIDEQTISPSPEDELEDVLIALRIYAPVLGYNYVKAERAAGKGIDEIILTPPPTYEEFFSRIEKSIARGFR